MIRAARIARTIRDGAILGLIAGIIGSGILSGVLIALGA